jgi:glycosyltransferase involved in cell wall biosynthesis
VTNITSYLAEGLAAKGHEVFVLTSAGNGGLQKLPEKEEHGGVSITRMRIYTRWPQSIKGRDEKSTKKEYWRQIKAYDPDALIVVCAQTWTLDWLLPHLKELGCVTVFYSHGYSLWKERYSYAEPLKRGDVLGAWLAYQCKKYYDRLYRYISMFDRAIYLSEQSNAAVYAQRYGLTNGRVLKNAIDDRFYEASMRHDGAAKETLSFLFVANYNENKNQEMLIRAFAQAKIGKSRLVLVGFETNPYYEHLQDVIRETLAGQPEKEVVFRIHISREEVLETYRDCDVFVCSSKSEIYPIVAHEAAAAAMPIISTDVGMYRQISGACIVNGTGEMTSAMEKLYHHPEERARRGGEAYEWVCGQGCRIQDKVDWLEQDLLGLLAGKTGYRKEINMKY